MYKVSFSISHKTCPVPIIRDQSVSVTYGNKFVTGVILNTQTRYMSQSRIC